LAKREHIYTAKIVWTGNTGAGTLDAKSYERSHDIFIDNKVTISGSSDAPFRGDITKHNPEDLFLSSLSVCHMLWYLHLCADANIIVTEYYDEPQGTMQENESGGGYFSEVTLNPTVSITDETKIDLANSLHGQARQKCFIANSCNFPVKHNAHCLLSN
jgi:organic hydroperoxide reductase OsmC/OhrA